MMQYRHLTAITLALAMLGACSERRPQTETRTSVQANNKLLKASDFDLGAVVAGVKANRFKNGAEIEAFANDRRNGVNNIDHNGDGQIDYVSVRDGDAGRLQFSVPGTNGQPYVFANLTINQETREINGGYANHVSGYQSHHYHDRFDVGDALMMMWMMDAMRPRYYGAAPVGYAGGTVRTVTERRRIRSSSGLQRATATQRPSNYRVRNSSPVRAGKAQARPTSKNLRDRKGAAGSSFRKTGQPKKTWGQPRNATPARRSPPPRRSRPSYGRSRSSGGRRR